MWQLDRHSERKVRNAFIASRLEQVPVRLPSQIAADSLEFRRVRVAGVFDWSREVIQLGRAVNGVPAVYVATPLVTSEGTGVLVERGWAASPDARAVNLAALAEPDSSVVEGVLLRSAEGALPTDASWPLRVRRADPVVLQLLYPYPLMELVLRRTRLPPGTPGGLGVAPLPRLTTGPHLSYAVQWFAFAIIAVVGPLIASGAFGSRTRARTGAKHY